MSMTISSMQSNQVIPQMPPSVFAFEIVDKLGSGEQADVYLLKNAAGEVFAGKCYHPRPHLEELGYPKEYLDVIFDADGKNKMAELEHEFAQKLQPCVYIIKTFEVIAEKKDGALKTWVIEEYVDGQVIRQIKSALTFGHYSRLVSQLFTALKRSFEAGFFHEDLHTGNIMIDAHGNLKLIDLGSFSGFDDCGDLVQGDLLDHMLNVTHMLTLFVEPSLELNDLQDRLRKLLQNRDGREQPLNCKSHLEFFMPIMTELLIALN